MQSLNWFQQHQIYWFWKECFSFVALALPVIRGIIIPSFFPLPGTEKYIGEYSACSRLLDCHANVACQIYTAPATLCGIYLYFLFQKCCKRDIPTRIRICIYFCLYAAYFPGPRSYNAAWHVDCPLPTCNCHSRHCSSPLLDWPCSLPCHSGPRTVWFCLIQFAYSSNAFSPL